MKIRRLPAVSVLALALAANAAELQIVRPRARVSPAPAAETVSKAGNPLMFIPGLPLQPLPNPAVTGLAKPGYLGVQLEDAGDEGGENNKSKGALVSGVVKDSPAENAGVKPGDMLMKFNGRAVESTPKLREMIRAVKPGEEVKFMVSREGKEVEMKAKLAAVPDKDPALAIGGAGMIRLPNNAVLDDEDEARPAVPGVVVFRNNLSTVDSGISSRELPFDPDAKADSVALRDGNRFTGKFRSIAPGHGLLFQQDGQQEMELNEKEVENLSFAQPEKLEPEAQPKVTLELRDGTILRGDALTMEKGLMHLTLHRGQQMEIPREHVLSAMLVADGESPQIYEGPSGMGGWITGRSTQSRWEFADGMLRCVTNGPITRDFGRLPDSVDFSFDVHFPRQMQHFSMNLFNQGSTISSRIGAISLNLSPDSIQGNHYDGRRYNNYSAQLKAGDVPDFSGKPETVRYRILVDRINGRMLIYVGGVKTADWKISKVKPEDMAKCGAGFAITPHVSMGDVLFQVGRIRILPWDGNEPANGKQQTEPAGDRAITGSGKKTAGKIVQIGAGEIVFQEPAATIPKEKSVFLRFDSAAPVKEFAAPVARAIMRNGSEFAVAQVRGDAEKLTLTTRYGSQVSLPPSALKGIEFFPDAAQPAAQPAGVGVLTLADGRQLKGQLLTPMEGGKVRWKIGAMKSPIEHPTADVAGIYFPRAGDGQKQKAEMPGSSIVRFVNGDWLPCDPAGAEGERVFLKTALAQKFSVPLSELRSLYAATVAESVNDGVSGPSLWSEGWRPRTQFVVGPKPKNGAKPVQNWLYHDGTYAFNGVRSDTGNMLAAQWTPYQGSYALSFEIADPSRTSRLSIQIQNSKESRICSISYYSGTLQLYLTPPMSGNGLVLGGRDKMNIQTKIENNTGAVRITVVFDKPGRAVRLFVGDKEAGKVALKAQHVEAAMDVASVWLMPYVSSVGRTAAQPRKPLVVRNIWVRPWEDAPQSPALVADAAPAGPADSEKTEPGQKKEAAPQSMIYLANGDELAGSIRNFSADTLSLNTELGELDLPLKRIGWIRFPGSGSAAQDAYPRLRFHSRGTLTVKDLDVGSERVKCTTLGGQQLDFPLELVKEIVWRPIASPSQK